MNGLKKVLALFLAVTCILFPATSVVNATEAGNAVTKDSLGMGVEDLWHEDVEPETGYAMEEGKDVKKSKITAFSASSSCGTNVTWNISGGTLTISGEGGMDDFSSSSIPWIDSRSEITKVVVNNGVTHIGEFAFYGCNNLESVELADTVTSLGKAAFYQCGSLTNATLPPGIKEIPTALFAECTSLTSVSVGEVVTIGAYAFQETKLTSFTVGKEVTEIDNLAFFKANVGSFAVAVGNNTFSAKDGVLYTNSEKTLFLYPAGTTTASYTIPSTVKEIGELAFCGSQLTNITIPSSVTKLGDSAFQNCYSLTSVTIPDSVTEAGMFTFYACKKLESVKFGKGLKVTGYEMFEECESLSKIDFGSGLEELDARTFSCCDSLTSVTLPANIKKIGNGAFAECRQLESFTAKGLKEIPYQEFLNDRALTNVVLNEGVTSIYRYAFGGCTNLLRITLPASVTYVHSHAFEKDTVITAKNTEIGSYGANGLRLLEFISVSADYSYTKAFEVLKLVNQQRKAAGQPEVKMNASLMDTAMKRAAETSILFSHTRPDGSSCFDMNSLMWGENIAYGQTTASNVMNSWMNSQGHKQNILEGSYTTIGIGCAKINGYYYWVQCFGKGEDQANCSQPADRKQTQKVQIATEEFDEADTTSGIIWGNPETYAYTSRLQLDSSSVQKGKTTNASYYLTNPGNKMENRLSAGDLKWSSSNTNIATVKDGVVTVKKTGSVSITATMAKGSYRASATVNVNLAAPKLTKVENVKSGVKIKWKKVKDASGYYVYRKAGSGKYSKIKTIKKGSTISFTDKSVKEKNGKTYIYAVKAYSGSTKSAYSSEKIVRLTMPTLTKLEKRSGKKIIVKWKKSKLVTGYQIQYAKSSKFTKAKTIKVKKASIESKTISKLTKGKKYYVRIRTYKTVSGKTYYSGWSKSKNIK